MYSLGLVPSAAISGSLAATAAILVSAAIERFGGVVGGLLGSMPSTIVPASIGFYLEYLASSGSEADPTKFQKSMVVVPVGMLLNSVFLWLWKVLPVLYSKFSGMLMLFLLVASSLTVWLVLAIASVFSLRAISSIECSSQLECILPVLLVGISALVLQLSGGLWNSWNLLASPKGRNKLRFVQMLPRGLFAGIAVCKFYLILVCSVLLSSVSPFAAGIASIFPAIFLVAMLSVWISQGKQVSQGAIGPLILGSCSVSVYSLLTAILVPVCFRNGMSAVGFIASWVVSILFVNVPVFYWLKWRTRQIIEPVEETKMIFNE